MKANKRSPKRRVPGRKPKAILPAGRFLDGSPVFGKRVFVAPGARLIGDVTIGADSSVWFNAVLRADIHRIMVGDRTNIQDNAVLHLAEDHHCRLGDWVTIGHAAVVHACTVADQVLVGMGAIVLDGAVIGAQSIIGAGTLIPQHFRVPEGVLVLGRPGRIVRPLSRTERVELKRMANKYVRLAREYRRRSSKKMTPF
jgi:carbonic anhydrase/acetyltransferase-like protein (isoleucine patch superfamily)